MSIPRGSAIGARLAAIVATIALGATAVLASTPTAAVPLPAKSKLDGLKVLLTNDDSAQGRNSVLGTDGKGLYELRKALCAAGADVLVVAPWAQQSGSGAQITPPGFAPVPFTVAPVAPPSGYVGDCAAAPSGGAVFGVCISQVACTADSPSASPADAVNVALSRFAGNYWPDAPDLVISGTNFGQNVGAMVNHSGTVGAAVTAREYGVPSIAISAEVPHDLTALHRVPFADSAVFGVRLVEALVAADLLDAGLTLNVNHPYVAPGERLGRPVMTEAGTSLSPSMDFVGVVPRTGGTYQLRPGSPTEETRGNADTTALARNDIPISLLDGDWSVSRTKGDLQVLLLALRR